MIVSCGKFGFPVLGVETPSTPKIGLNIIMTLYIMEAIGFHA